MNIYIYIYIYMNIYIYIYLICVWMYDSIMYIYIYTYVFVSVQVFDLVYKQHLWYGISWTFGKGIPQMAILMWTMIDHWIRSTCRILRHLRIYLISEEKSNNRNIIHKGSLWVYAKVTRLDDPWYIYIYIYIDIYIYNQF